MNRLKPCVDSVIATSCSIEIFRIIQGLIHPLQMSCGSYTADSLTKNPSDSLMRPYLYVKCPTIFFRKKISLCTTQNSLCRLLTILIFDSLVTYVALEKKLTQMSDYSLRLSHATLKH